MKTVPSFPILLFFTFSMSLFISACANRQTSAMDEPPTTETPAPATDPGQNIPVAEEPTPEQPTNKQNAKNRPIEDMIQVEQPKPHAVISSPQTITGQARGYWFFEADFPIILEDEQGKVIATAIATADGEWMTENFVPFTATLEFNRPTDVTRAFLVFQRDNPSDLRENDRELRIPIRLK